MPLSWSFLLEGQPGETPYAAAVSVVRRAATGLATADLNNDASFGPQFGQAFDFTMLFSNTILTIIPASLMIAGGLIYIIWYQGETAVTSRNELFGVKMLFAVALLACDLARSAIWSMAESSSFALLTGTTVAASIISTISSLMVAIALYYDHFYALQPTSFLSIFLTISTITEAARARSFFFRANLGVIAGLSVGCAVTKFVLMVLQEVPKRLDPAKFKRTRIVPDARVGLWGRVLLFWAGPFFVHGFRNEITMDDLGFMGPAASSKQLASDFGRAWSRTDKTNKMALFKACLRSSPWLTLAAWFSCAVGTVMRFVGLFLMRSTLEAFRDKNTSLDTKYGLIAATFLVYAMGMISNSLYSSGTNRMAVHIRSILTTAMTKKHMRISSSKASDAALLSLMTADVDGIIDAIPEMYQVTLVIPELAFALYFTYTAVGIVFFLPLIPILLSTAIGHYTGVKNEPAVIRWNQSIQTRVASTATVLSRITGIKMMGLEPIMIRFLQDLRSKEIADSMPARKLLCLVSAAMPLNYWFTPASVFIGGVFWTIWKDGLDTVTPWVVLNMIMLIRGPMWYMLKSWTICIGLFACFSRIQDFLLLTERQEKRQVRSFGHAYASSSQSEKSKTSRRTRRSAEIEEEMRNRCVALNMVSVASDLPGKYILHEVDLAIPSAKLTMVVGAVGSGKTVLLRTILGEMEFCRGTIQISTKKMAYCGQKTWLRNGSFKEAILGYTALDQNRYDSVIAACSLGPDIAVLGGHDSPIGSNGARLSGGQKQRVALARAIYSYHPIVVCDDILSALDFDTATDVFDAVFGPKGMLKRHGRSAIFAAHERTWLSSADQVIYLNGEGGAVVHKGKNAIGTFVEAEGCFIDSQFGNGEASEPTNPEQPYAHIDYDLDIARRNNSNPASKLDTALYRHLFRGIPVLEVVNFVFLIIVHAFMERGLELFIRLWIERDPKNKNWIWGMIALGFFGIAVRGAAAWNFHMRIAPTIAHTTHTAFTNSVLRATLPYLTATSNGVMLNRFSQDMTLLAQEMPFAFYRAIHVFAVYLTNVGFIVSGTDYTAISVPAIFILLWLLQAFYLRTSRQLRLLDLEAKTPLFNLANEMVSGLEHVRGFQWEEDVIEQSFELLDYSQKSFYYMMTIQRWLQLVLDAFGVGVATMVVSIGLLKQDLTSEPALGLSLLNVTAAGDLSTEMVQIWTKLETSLGSVARLKDFEETTPQEKDDPDVEDPPELWPSRGRIEFKNLTAKYGPDLNAPLALERVSVTFESGQKVLLTGRTGSGKSTMVLSMLNLLNLDGEILIDDVDITKVPHHKLRSKITTLPQDSMDTPGTVLDNLVPCNLPEDDKSLLEEKTIKEILRDVCIWDYIDSRGGLHMPLEEMHFSAGQKQLLYIARAIIHHLQFKTQIILMDEVTSSMDHQTRVRVNKTMELAFGKCTWVIISHQLRDTTECDLIVTLSNGWLVEVDLLDTIGADLARLFSELAGLEPAAIEGEPRPLQSDGARPHDDTRTRTGQAQSSTAAASEGERLMDVAIGTDDSEANPRRSHDSQRSQLSQRRGRRSRRSGSAGRGAGVSPGAQLGFRAPSPSFRGRESVNVVFARANARRLKNVLVPQRPAPRRPKTPPLRDIEAYISDFVMDNGSSTRKFTLRRPDLKFKQHQTPYHTKLPTEKEMIDEDATLSGEEGEKLRAKKKKKEQERIEALKQAAAGEAMEQSGRQAAVSEVEPSGEAQAATVEAGEQSERPDVKQAAAEDLQQKEENDDDIDRTGLSKGKNVVRKP